MRVRLIFRKCFLLGFVGVLASQAHAETTRTIDIWGNLLSPLAGGIIGGANLAIGGFSLGPAYESLSVKTGLNTFKLKGYGARLNYYFGSAIRTGMRLSAIAYKSKIDVTSGSLSGSVSAKQGTFLIGFHNVDSVLTLGIGAGVGYYSTGSSITIKDSNSGTTSTVAISNFSGLVPEVELTLGLAF